MNQPSCVLIPCVRWSLIASCAAALISCASQEEESIEGKVFKSPEDAAAALVAAVRADSPGEIEAVLGPGSHDIVQSGDDVADKEARRLFLKAQAEKSSIDTSKADAATLVIGDLEWPFPVPIVKTNEGWAFDSEAAHEEIS